MNVARDPAGVSASRRRRDRRLRSFWRHECMAVRMALATAAHHSSLRVSSTSTQTEYVAGPAPVTEYVAPAHAVVPFSSPAVSYEAPAPVVGYVAPAPAVTYAVPAPVIGSVAPAPAVTYAAPVPVIDSVAPAHSVTYAVPAPVIDSVAPAHSVTYAVPAPVIDSVAPAHSVTYAAPAPVFENVAPAPVSEYIAPVPAVTFLAHSQQLRPAFSAAAVTPGVNLDAEFVVPASQVVGSLPPGEVFAVPVFHPVHHGLRAQGDFLRVVTRQPTSLVDVMLSSRVHRHIMEDLGECAPSVQLLDLPVPLMVDQPVDILKIIAMLLPAVDEQVIDVPKIIQDSTPQRLKPPEPQQLVEQLVEVPTVLTPTRIALQMAEQIVDTPVSRGRVHGSLPGQSSATPLPESIEWVELSDANGRPWFWNRRSQATVRKAPPGVQVVWVGVKDEEGGTWYWHRRTRATGYSLPPLPPE